MRISLILLGSLILSACSNADQSREAVLSSKKTEKPVSFVLIASVEGSIRGMEISNDDEILLSGQFGKIYRILDSGQSVQTYQLVGYEARDLRDVVQIDDSTILTIAIGSPGDIIRSNNLGETWKNVYHNNDSLCFLDAIEFWDSDTGIVVGDPVDDSMFVLKTTNGGLSWNRIFTLPKRLDVENAFAASGTSIEIKENGLAWIGMGGTEARVFITSDYGNTWSVTSTPLLKGSDAQGIYSICFADERHGVAVGGNWERKISDSTITYTNDGGKTWALPEVGVDGYRSCVAHGGTGKQRFMITCGSSGVDISYDFGKTWKKVSDLDLNVVAFIPDTNTGYAADSHGQIYRLIINQ